MASAPERFKQYLRFSSVGLELGFSVVLGLLIGQWLDSKLGTAPWLLLLFLGFGVAAGFRRVYRLLRELNDHNAEPPEPPKPRRPPKPGQPPDSQERP